MYSEFDFDGLQRLRQGRVYGNAGGLKSTTTITYNYGGPDDQNSVDIRTEYDGGPTKHNTKFYDGLGRYYKTITHDFVDGQGQTITDEAIYDNFGRVASKLYLPHTPYTTLEYYNDPFKRVKRETLPDENTLEYEYCGEGGNFVSRVYDELGEYTATHADLLGRTIKTEGDNVAGTTLYEYDDWGNIKKITTPAGSGAAPY